MRKNKIAAILVLTIALTLTACGSPSAPTQQSSTPITPSAGNHSRDTPSLDADQGAVQENLSGGNVFDSIDITHLDDFKQYGFTYEELPAGYVVDGRQYIGVLTSDVAKIYVHDGVFSYEINLLEGNLRDVQLFQTHNPKMEGGNRSLDVGYGLKLSKAQMRYMGFVAKCFYENPSAPFAHLVPDEIADSAAQNNIFIDVKHANDTWRILFCSLQYSFVYRTFSDGSQDIIPNAVEISYYADNKSEPISFRANGVDEDSAAYMTVRQAMQSGGETGCALDTETLEWSFTPEISSALVELMQALNTPYEK